MYVCARMCVCACVRVCVCACICSCVILKKEQFLSEFAKLRKATISFVMSVRLSVCLHGKTLLPLDGFSWKLTFDYFWKICRKKLKFHWTLTRTAGSVHEELYIYIYICILFVIHKSQHTFYFQWHFPENPAVYEIMWKNIVEPDRPQMTIWRMRTACWIPKATKRTQNT